MTQIVAAAIVISLCLAGLDTFLYGSPQTVGQWIASDEEVLRAPLFIYLCVISSMLNVIEVFRR